MRSCLLVLCLIGCSSSTPATNLDAAIDLRVADTASAPDSGSCGNLGAPCGPGQPACGPGFKCCNASANCSDANAGHCYPSSVTWNLTGTCLPGFCAAPNAICLMECPGCDFSICASDALAACLCARVSLYGCP